MKSARALILLTALTGLLMLTGCLAVESKIYRCTLNADGSGKGTITFVNIFSQDDDGQDVSTSDFDELITNYLNGSKFEEDTPRIHVTGKRLYEENGKLCGEVSYEFAHADSAGFVLTPGCQCAPILFFPGVSGETIVETNGTVRNAGSDILSWPAGTKEMWYKVSVSADSGETHSLLALYQAWKGGQK